MSGNSATRPLKVDMVRLRCAVSANGKAGQGSESAGVVLSGSEADGHLQQAAVQRGREVGAACKVLQGDNWR